MDKIRLNIIKKIPNIVGFILISVPFTLITIGNVTIWLITFTWRGILLLLNLFIRLNQNTFFWVKIIFKKILISIKNIFKGISQILLWPVKKIVFLTLQITSVRHRLRIPSRWLYFTAGAATTFLFVFLPFQIYQLLISLPDPTLLTNRPIPVTTKIFDRNNNLLYEIYAEQNRTPVTLDDIPLVMRQATLAIEDRNFYNHIGISPRGIARAAKETFINNRLQGGSTITQQLIKNSLLTPEPTISRKIKEIILAFWAERLYTKNQILTMYFNQVPYGGTYWGIEAAADGYFGKTVSELDLAQAAFLAGLPAAPTLYSPFGEHPDLFKKRQAEVLNRMIEEGFITQQEADKAFQEEINFVSQTSPIKAPHFVMYVKQLLTKRYGLRLVEQGGLRITTTLDLSIQDMAEKILSKELGKIAHLRVGNGAVVVTKPKTGEILAMVGSKNYFDTEAEGNVNVTLALRQPGSSIKVITYSAALQNGFTAASIIDDSPVTYRTAGQPIYAPVNYDGKFHGRVPLRYALGNSYNIPAVKVLNRIGLNTMINQGKKMGIKSWNDTSRFGLSLTLGGGEVTMLDMANVYGTLANSGKYVEVTPIKKVTTYKGDMLEDLKPSGLQAVPEEVSFIISDILSDNQARTWAFGPNSTLVIPGKTVAVKTGTSNDKRDNWTIGYTPSYVVTVWVGNNDNSPMHPTLTSGVTGAAPVWHEIFNRLLKDKPDEKFVKPDNVISIPCFFGRNEYFIKGTEPKGGCPIIKPSPKPSPTP